jgi:hypothetical protein
MIVEDSLGGLSSGREGREGVNDVMLNNPLAVFSSIIHTVVVKENRREIQVM